MTRVQTVAVVSTSEEDTSADALTVLAGVQLTLLGIFLTVGWSRSTGIAPLGVVVRRTAVVAYG